MRILVIGLGQIGGSLFKRLSESFERTYGIDKKIDLDLKDSYQNRVSQIDIKDEGRVGDLIFSERIDLIINCIGFQKSTMTDTKGVSEVYLDCLKNICRICKKNNIKKLIHFSSLAVYGNYSESVLMTTTALSPTSTYGRMKLAGEEQIRETFKQTPTEYIIIRLSGIFGEYPNGRGSQSSRLINRILRKAINKNTEKEILSLDKGDEYLYVEDVSQMVDDLISNWKFGSNTVNMGSEQIVSPERLIGVVEELLKINLNYEVNHTNSKVLPPLSNLDLYPYLNKGLSLYGLRGGILHYYLKLSLNAYNNN